MSNAVRRSPPNKTHAPVSDDELPLPKPARKGWIYTSEQMRQYARDYHAHMLRKMGDAGLTFDQIEAAFPEGATTEQDGSVRVSAQWLHDFADNIAKLAQARAAGAERDGWQRVPLAPTKEMLHVGMRFFHDKREPASKALEVYNAMFAAAPSADEKEGEE